MAELIQVFGIVQGVGLRPFAARLAKELSVVGSVANKGAFVEIFAQGSDEALENFKHGLMTAPPQRAVISDIRVTKLNDRRGLCTFEIIKSKGGSGDILLPPDIAICDDCIKELFDKTDRRYLHPFINCTQCGPRLTITKKLPYDRERTSMADFPMCGECAEEYYGDTRRYDAQPVCCNACGPEVFVLGGREHGGEAITKVRQVIMSGGIAAVKGIGGFHLCCDAKNAAAVNRLRTFKNRPVKPFAVMCANIDAAKREGVIGKTENALLCGWQKPIVLLRKKQGDICEAAAPDTPYIGIMLPYAPVQLLIFNYPDDIAMSDALIMTSANTGGAPICKTDEDAEKELSGICDIILTNNRDILIRADDSVCDVLFDKPYMIRRSRGFSPLPFAFGKKAGSLLAAGGELKNSFCIAKNGLFYLSPYVGDMEDVRSVSAFDEAAEHMCMLLDTHPKAVVCDMHPAYNSVSAAEKAAKKAGVPLIKTQHHHAHILSCMAENGYDKQVIGAAFDGTGYGTDGSIWGGEILICGLDGFERAGSIAPFMQIGGDSAAREPRKAALSVLFSVCGEDTAVYAKRLDLCSADEYRLYKNMLKNRVNCVLSTSCGRLFDAAAAVLGIKTVSTFEGEAAAALMHTAKKHPYKKYPELLSDGRLNTSQYLRDIADRYIAGADKAELAYEFHAVLADMTAAACVRARQISGIEVCALSGGVFGNTLLTELAVTALKDRGFKVLTHSLVPPNDGGIALGQAVYGIYAKQE